MFKKKGYNSSEYNVVWSKTLVQLDTVFLGGTNVLFSQNSSEWFSKNYVFNTQDGATGPTRINLRDTG